MQALALNEAHIEQLELLAPHHRDPFDQLLIAQAQTEKMVLVSADSIFESYDVAVIR
ncbi:MAG: PIN domain-containing protein [Cyanobacteria bacterium P01_D01_bin.1]